MLSFIRWITDYFFHEEEIDDDNDDNFEADHVLTKKCHFDNKPVAPSNLSEKEARHLTGTVTYLSEEYGLIDKKFYFDVGIVPREIVLKEGDVVQYVVCRARENEEERVVRIEQSCDWNDAERPVLEDDETIERILTGKVVERKGNEVFIKPLNIQCNLNYLGSGFLPVKGDWISLHAEVTVKKDVINSDTDVVSIKSIKPLRMQSDVGNITLARKSVWSHWSCVIENKIYFSTEHCSIKFIPYLGLQVKYRAVESDQGHCTWRAIYVEPLEEKANDATPSWGGNVVEDIVITGKPQFGPMKEGETAELTLEIQNVGHIPHELNNVSFQCGRSESQLSLVSPKKSVTLNPGDTLDAVFACRARFLGTSTEGVILRFRDFQIEKSFRIDVSVDEDMQKLMEANTGPAYALPDSRQRLTWRMFDMSNAVYGAKPTFSSRFRKGAQKVTYPIPQELMKIVLSESGHANVAEVTKNIVEYAPQVKENLCEENYRSKFHTLLHLEEIEGKILYRKYDLFGVVLRRRGQYLALDISDLVDAKFHLRHGVNVILTQSWSQSNPIKQVGYIREVHETEAFISFQESFHESYNETVCDVTFQPTRSNYIHFHRAVDMAATHLGFTWLFPSVLKEKPSQLQLSINEDDGGDGDSTSTKCEVPVSKYQYDKDKEDYLIPKRRKPTLAWFNEKLNERQKLAVVNLLKGKGRPLPYIIFGPPGTGKTVTLLEIVLQIYHLFSDSRILIATPSNSAADLICEHLVATGKFLPGEMIRILSYVRSSRGDVPESILQYCATVYEEEWCQHANRSLQNIRSSNVNDCVGAQRIVIGTCAALGMFQGVVEERNHHFSHIIIDEAGQASEPEALIPISFADLSSGRVILCGDPKQLGPVCMSRFAGTMGLKMSFLERVTNSPPYAKDLNAFPDTGGYDPNCITRLNINYRSVPEILRLPSQMFYNSELIASVSQTDGIEADIIRRFPWDGPGRDSPPAIIFHGLDGENKREDNSYSWYNPLEAWQSVCYLKRLYNAGLAPDDVGIVTPYQKQVEKLRMLLTALSIPPPKIGSVEEFQGQERHVIMLTTVRSPSDAGDGSERCLGFLASPRRLNVAITRARALLIIIGNPFTLYLDPYWRNVLRYCLANNSYTGCSIEKLQ